MLIIHRLDSPSPQSNLMHVTILHTLFNILIINIIIINNNMFGLTLRLCLCTCLVLLVSAKRLHYDTILVDQSGHANSTTIQAAIDSVPQNNLHWVCIKVKSGTYREKVKIPYDKPFIILKGDGKRKTEIVWDDHDNVAQSPTFTSLADNVVVRSISFRNSYNSPLNQNPRKAAVAAVISGDKSAFYRCGFFGLQDTLWDDQGRHYYYHCTIQGAVDFIFGNGQSIFENCGISVVGAALGEGLAGFITAQGRENPNDGNGFVFKNCMVYGSGSTFLGRPWRPFSRVLFFNSSFSSVIDPKGWDASNLTGHEKQLTFAEHNCYGDGAKTSRRVRWEKELSGQDLEEMLSIKFIDSEGWLKNQPI